MITLYKLNIFTLVCHTSHTLQLFKFESESQKVSDNLYTTRDTNVILKSDISTQEKIRLLFRLGFTRSQIVKMTGVKYQVIFKATNPKYAPKRWVKVLTLRLSQERSVKNVEVEEVSLLEDK